MRSLVKKWQVKVKLGREDNQDVLAAVAAESRRQRRRVSAAELFREYAMPGIREIAERARKQDAAA